MCGIVSAVSERNVVPLLLEGLSSLEYRGYDSAGVAVINGALHRLRTVGRVAELERLAATHPVSGRIGIAHTRWATHGVPSERNAHPHVSAGVSVVHNGIIENHEALRRQLQRRGYTFTSDTDTEVVVHLVHAELQVDGQLLLAVRRATRQLSGAYAIAVISDTSPARLVVARQGAPLLLGLGDRENFAASDTAALIRRTQRIVHLEDGDCAEISSSDIHIIDGQGLPVSRPEHHSELNGDAVLRGDYQHYMQKEIFEQPEALARTLEVVNHTQGINPQVFGPGADRHLAGTAHVLILACGTSYHAGLVARYWIESLARLPCTVEIASEYRYRDSAITPDTLVVALSQSGETADTLAALHYAKSLGLRTTLGICNVPESSLVRSADLAFLTRAGPEIGVASTKAFTTQLAALMLLTLVLAKARGHLSLRQEGELLLALSQLPKAVRRVLRLERQIMHWAKHLAQREHALFLGRGTHYPIAREGALKLKEVSYIHAEAYAAGELKHGPLALVTGQMPVVALAPKDALLEKLRSNLQEVRARGGELFVLADRHSRIDLDKGLHVIRMPEHAGLLSPILHTIPLQLLAYFTALERKSDVDKPRNLAKSVTVE